MIIGNGTINVEIDTADGNGDFEQIKSKKRTAGGQLRTRTTGNTYLVSEIFEATGTILNNVMDLINDNSATYYYTPTTIPPEFTAADFPMSVSIDYTGKSQKVFDGEIKYYATLAIESTEVFNQ